MNHPIAKNIVSAAYRFLPSATVDEARYEFPRLRNKTASCWATRISGADREDAVDIALTFADEHLVEIWVRATLWDPRDVTSAWTSLQSFLTVKYGQTKTTPYKPAGASRDWPFFQHESVRVEKRVSDEDGQPLTQFRLIRTFQQPQASGIGARSLFDLFNQPVAKPSLDPIPRGKPAPARPKVTAPARKYGPIRYFGTKVVQSFVFKGGPHCPKWPNGRPRPASYAPLEDGPLFFSTIEKIDLELVSARIKTLQAAFDTLLTPSAWEPFFQVDEEGLRHHSVRWWWLGGGSMLHLFVREAGGPEASIVTHVYEGLDGPPDQAVRRPPTTKELQSLLAEAQAVSKASGSSSAGSVQALATQI